tara:strand:+ start:11566 stop:12363 length:798 start_codon:yes stop_codon:yes gene_type:complete
MKDIFDLSNRTVLITGGAGLMGRSHTEAIIERGGRVIIGDIDYDAAFQVSRELNCKYNLEAQRQIVPVYLDVLDKNIIHGVAEKFPNINVLINNASKNPTVEDGSCLTGHFETMGVEDWREGIETALTGTFLCSQVFCNKFAKDGFGIVVNISSDLGVLAPDQRIYGKDRKPITYSAAKFGIVGMTKYLATYFADKNIRVNCLSPGGIYNNRLSSEFLKNLTNLIPMGRMAEKDEYKGIIAFLCSEGSSYMTGENLVINGGRAAW